MKIVQSYEPNHDKSSSYSGLKSRGQADIPRHQMSDHTALWCTQQADCAILFLGFQLQKWLLE